MDDILRLLYPQKFTGFDLKSLLRPYCSSANKVLLDYKQFRDFILNGLKGKFKDPNQVCPEIHGNLNALKNDSTNLNATQLRLQYLKDTAARLSKTVVQDTEHSEERKSSPEKTLHEEKPVLTSSPKN